MLNVLGQINLQYNTIQKGYMIKCRSIQIRVLIKLTCQIQLNKYFQQCDQNKFKLLNVLKRWIIIPVNEKNKKLNANSYLKMFEISYHSQMCDLFSYQN
jgi:hypothetical protein